MGGTDFCATEFGATPWGDTVKAGDPVLSGGKIVGVVTSAEGGLFTVLLDDEEYMSKFPEYQNLSMILGCGDQA